MAANITISTIDIPNCRYTGTTIELRIYPDSSFIAIDGQVIQAPDNLQSPRSFYQTVTCTLSSGILTVPQFSIHSTTDANQNQSARYQAYFYVDGVKRDLWLPDTLQGGFWVRPTYSTGTVTTWALIETDNHPTRRIRDDNRTYTQDQINVLINNAASNGNPATTSTTGRIKVSTAPVDALAPIAVGDNDLRVTAETFAAQYASFSAAITAVGASSATLTVSTAMTVTASLTVPSNVTLRFTGAGTLTVSSGQTLTINGPLESPTRQIFAGSGVVRFTANRSIEAFYPQWWGVRGDSNGNASNGTDDTAAMQACVAAVPDYGTIRLTKGLLIRLTSNPGLSITARKGLRIVGETSGGAINGSANVGIPGFVYDGAASGTAIMNDRSFGTRFTDIGVYDREGGSSSNMVGIDIDMVTGSSGQISSDVIIERVSIWSGSTASPDFVGVRIANTSSNNCEKIVIRDSSIYAGGGTGIEVGKAGGGSNAFGILVENCNLVSTTTTGYGVHAFRGQVFVRGGLTESELVAFLFEDNATGSVERVNSEHFKQFLVHGSGASARMQAFTISHCRIAPAGVNLAATAVIESSGVLDINQSEFSMGVTDKVYEGHGLGTLDAHGNHYSTGDLSLLNYTSFATYRAQNEKPSTGATINQFGNQPYTFQTGLVAHGLGLDIQTRTTGVTLTKASTASQNVFLLNGTSNVVTVLLPNDTTSNEAGRVLTFKRLDAPGFPVTISGNGYTIDGAATYSLSAQWATLTIIFDGTQWVIISKF